MGGPPFQELDGERVAVVPEKPMLGDWVAVSCATNKVYHDESAGVSGNCTPPPLADDRRDPQNRSGVEVLAIQGADLQATVAGIGTMIIHPHGVDQGFKGELPFVSWLFQEMRKQGIRP
jgi:hypothetical protein